MLCVVPARAGSKRFPGKNLQSLDGETLIERALKGAIESRVFRHIVFTSDDPDALDIASRLPVTLHQRSADLAMDDARAVAVVADLLKQPAYAEAQYAMCLFLTSPFRTASHIRSAAERLEQGFDSVLSIMESPEPPQFTMEKQGDSVVPWISYDYFRKITNKRALGGMYCPNFAIQGAHRDVIAAHNGFVGEKCGYVEMTADESVDIDTERDLEWASFLLEKGYAGK